MTAATPPDTVAVATGATESHRWRLHPILLSGLILLVLIALVAVLAPMFLTTDANALTDQTRLSPSPEHPLGTDEFGRDLLARSLVATRLTLLLTISASAISVIVGVIIGLAVWLLPVRVRRFIIGVNSVAVAFPSLVLALVIAAILGPGAWTAALAVGISSIPAFVRLTVNMAAPVLEREYVSTARLLHVSRPLVMTRHVLPNMAEPLLVLAASNFAVTLVELSGLSFIGLGVQSPEYDFGLLLSDALAAIYTQPSQVVGPSVMIMLTGLAAMLIGDGLAASSNPRTRGARRATRTGMLHGEGTSAPQDSEANSGSDGDANAVRVRDLKVTTGSGIDLVKGISFEVAPGEIVGLVGESGSGKSLTAMTLAGLVPEGVNATASAIVAAGNDMLSDVPPKTLAQDIALIYQDPMSTFNPALRIETQLTEVARTHLGFSRGAARRALLERFEQLRISRPARRLRQHPHELSGGMLQRAMIASSLIADSKLIIADEPTTALDVTVQAAVLRQFVAAARELGASVLFISHDLGVVEALCDRVMVMHRGEIVEEMTADRLARRDVTHPYTQKLLDAAEYVEAL